MTKIKIQNGETIRTHNGAVIGNVQRLSKNGNKFVGRMIRLADPRPDVIDGSTTVYDNRRVGEIVRFALSAVAEIVK